MPNHVTTVCKVTGLQDHLDAFALLIDGGIDFQKIIPMPDVVRETESSTDATLGYFAAHDRFPRSERGSLFGGPKTLRGFGMVPKHIQTAEQLRPWLEENHPGAVAKGEKIYAAECETGFSTWYEWATARWGTKWNAYSQETREREADRLTFQFVTAWSFPEPVFYALRKMFPGLVFDVATYDEGGNFAAVGEWGGKNDFRYVKATDEMYERVYGRRPGHDAEEDEPSTDKG